MDSRIKKGSIVASSDRFQNGTGGSWVQKGAIGVVETDVDRNGLCWVQFGGGGGDRFSFHASNLIFKENPFPAETPDPTNYVEYYDAITEG